MLAPSPYLLLAPPPKSHLPYLPGAQNLASKLAGECCILGLSGGHYNYDQEDDLGFEL
jgi:hypothetical protein